MPFRRKRHPILGLIEDRPLVLAVAIIVGVGLLAGGVWWLAEGPRRSSNDDPAMIEMLASGEALEKEYLAISAVRDPGAEDLQILARAIENQRNWMRAVGGSDPEQVARLREMEATHARAKTRFVATASRAAEDEGRKAIEEGRFTDALAHLQKALEGQKELNMGHARTEHRDLHRESSLAQEVELLRVEPLAQEMATALARAKSSAESGHVKIATEAYRNARDIQERINREFPRVKYADSANIDRLEVEIDTLASEWIAKDIKELERRAVSAAATGRQEEAAGLFAEAIELQRGINTSRPRSRFASIERLAMLDTERQTALGSALAGKIRVLDTEVTSLLAARDVAAALPKIVEGGLAMDELASRYPRSRATDPGVRLKFNFLLLAKDSLAPTVGDVSGAIRRVPESQGVMMLRTEVSQELYQRVMGSNPSRNPGAGRPVDSASWNEAEEFCRRLSWMLGREVRLPSEGEFRKALGNGEEFAQVGLIWRPPGDDLRPRPVADGPANSQGFSDLIGNVAEWLDAAGTTGIDSAPVAAGSFLDLVEGDPGLVVATRPKSDRNRTTGFRFVIESR